MNPSQFISAFSRARANVVGRFPRQNPTWRLAITIVGTALLLACGESVLPTEPESSIRVPTAHADYMDSTGVIIVDSTAATITTDRLDYAPGDTVVITGTHWAPGETVHLLLEEVQALHEPRTWDVVANENGSLEDRSFIPEEHHIGVTFVLSATGETSGFTAVTHFTDGPVTVTPANASISSDNAAPSGSFTTLTGPALKETASGDIGTGTFILKAPASFDFDAGGAAPTLNIGCTGGGAGATNTAASVTGRTDSTITITVSTASVARTCTVTYQNVRVRPASGVLPSPASQNILWTGGTATVSGVNAATNFGTLTQLVGATAKLVVTLPGQTFTAGVGNSGTATAQTAGTAFNITKITATDRFFNVATSYSSATAKTLTYTGPGNNGASFMPSYTTSVVFSNGVSTTTLATTLKKAESTTITVGDGIISGPASSSLTVNVGAFDRFVVTGTDDAAIPTQAAGTPFNVKFRASDAASNTITSFSGGSDKVTVSSTGTLSAGAGTSAAFTNGVLASHSVTISNAGSFTITGTRLTGGSQTGTSNSFTVTAPACTAASVVTHPVDASVAYPNNASFTATGSGSPSPSIQWQVKVGTGAFTDISGETSTILNLTSPPVSSSTNQYRAVFTNNCSGTQTATSNAATLTVAPKSITVTPTGGQTKVFGTSDPTLTYTLSEAVTVTGALGRAAGEDVGDYAITLGTLSAGTNYSLALSGTVNFSITKANQAALTWSTAPPASATYGSNFIVAATGGSGTGAITYSSSGGCTNSGATFTMTSGTTACTVKADKAADTNYLAATQLSTNVTAAVDPTTTTVTSSAAGNTSAFGESVTFTATVTGSVVNAGSVSFRSGGTSCTEGLEVQAPSAVNGSGEVTYTTSALSVGSHTIRACYAGNSDFGASSGTISHTVGKATATVTLTNLSHTYDGSSKSAGATTTPSGLTVGFTYDAAPTAPTDAGSYAVVGTVSDTNYQGSASGTFVIAKASGSVSINNIPSSATFGGNFTPAYTKSGDGTASVSSLTTSVCTVSGGVVNFIAAGECQLQAAVTEGTNYLAATGSTQSFTIGKASATITLTGADLNQTFDGNPKSVGYSTNPSGLTGVTVAYSQSGSAVASPTNAGSYDVTATLDNASYSATPAQGTLVIGKANQATLTISAPTAGSFGQFYTMSASGGSSSGAISFDVVPGSTACAIVSGGANDGKLEITGGTGSCSFTATRAGDSNYNDVTSLAQAVTVSKATPTFSFNLGSLGAKTFGDDPFSVASFASTNSGGSITFALGAGSVGCSVTSAGSVTISGAATGSSHCIIEATLAATTNYEGAGPSSQQFNIAKAAGSVTIRGPASITYDQSDNASVVNKTGDGIVTFEKVSGPCNVTGAGSVTMTSGTGTCKVQAQLAEGTNHTAATSNEVSIAAAKASATLNLVAADLSQTYNGSGKSVGYTTTPSGLTGVTVSYNQGGSAVASPTNAGSYDVRASLTNDNYSATDATGTLVINKADQAALTISAPTAGTYGQFYTMSASGGSTGGAITFDVVSGSTACAISSTPPNAGKLEITSGTGTCSFTATMTGNDNYNPVTSGAQIVTVSKATPTFDYNLSALPAKTYGDASFSIASYATTNGDGSISFALGTGSVGCSVTAGGTVTITGAAVGSNSCIIDATLASTANYNGAGPTSQSFHIAKAAATINLVAADLSQTYNATTKSVGYTTTPSGLTGVSVTYAQGGSSATPKNAGTYDVNATLTNDNYEASPATGALQILQAHVTGTFTAQNKVYDGNTSAQVNTRSLTGVFAADALTALLSGGTAAFDTKDVGTGKTVTLTGAAISGAAGPNYVLDSVQTTTANITPAAVTVNLSATPNPTQYSDSVVITPTVAPAPPGLSGESVNGTFVLKIGTRTVASGVAPGTPVNVILTEFPGLYNVTADFTPSTPSNYASGNGATASQLRVGTENASAKYTGPVYAVANSNGQAAVLLQAVIYDAADGHPGDVRNAKVTFVNRATGGPIGSCKDLKVDLVTPGNTTIGNAACSWTANLAKTENAIVLDVGMTVTDAYGDNSTEEDVSIIVSRALPNTITGVGSLNAVNPMSSLGTIAPNSPATFGFNVSYNKQLTSLQGGASIMFTAGGKTYRVKSNSLLSLNVNAQSNGGTASFTSKASIQDVTNPLVPLSVDGNITVQLDMIDGGTTGGDKLAITVFGKNGGVLYSNYYTPAGKTAQQSPNGTDPNAIIVK